MVGLIVPKQRLPSASQVRSKTFAENRKQRVRCREGIRDRLLRNALQQRRRKLVSSHAEKWRLQKADGLIARNRRQIDVHLVGGKVAGIADAQRRFIVDAVSQADARLER